MVAEPLVVLHVDHTHDLPVELRDERDVAQLTEVTRERLAVRRVVGSAGRHAPAELHEEAGNRAPVVGRGHADGDLAHGKGQSARCVAAPWARRRVPGDRGLEVDAFEVRERGEPRHDIAELVLEIGPVAGPHRLRELPDLLGEPPERDVSAPGPVALEIETGHRGLQLADLHGCRSLVRRTRSLRSSSGCSRAEARNEPAPLRRPPRCATLCSGSNEPRPSWGAEERRRHPVRSRSRTRWTSTTTTGGC